MDSSCPTHWNTEIADELPLPGQRRHFGVENELVELLWQNGEVVLHSQTRRQPNQTHKNDQSEIIGNLSNLIQGDDAISWIDCPVDEPFGKEFCSNLMSEVGATELPRNIEGERFFKFGASDGKQVFRGPQQPNFDSISFPSPRFETLKPAAPQDQGLGGVKNAENLNLPEKGVGFRHIGQPDINELSAMTIPSSHCGSNQIASSCGIGNRTLSTGVDANYAQKISLQSDRREIQMHEQPFACSSGGSGSSFWKTSNQSGDINCHKRKIRHVERSENLSEATEMESASGNKSFQKSGTSLRNRVAEVHNLSERKRRDRINEKMKALQDLIPHSSKLDKASMLDEAIEYMKSLQSQIQLMWMGSGMAQMVHPGIRHCMPRVGMGVGTAPLPTVHNLMHLSRMPLVDHAMAMPPTHHSAANLRPMLNPLNYQNQVPTPGFPEQYANFMSLYAMQTTPQPVNMFGYGSQPQNHVPTPPGNGNGPVA